MALASTLSAIIAIEADSGGKTKGSVRPLRSRMTTTTRRLPFWLTRKATVDAVFFEVGRLHVAAEVAAVDFDFAGRLDGLDLGGECFADFVGKNESRLVLHARSRDSARALLPLTSLTKIAMAKR